MIRILFLGDIVGRPGRKALTKHLQKIVAEHDPSVIIANVENAAGGAGISARPLQELQGLGIDVMTSGNHIWDNRESYELLEIEPFLLRPANYPPGVPGRGAAVYNIPEGRPGGGLPVGIINLQGRVFMREIDCPFQIADRRITELKKKGVKAVFVDFHAEATSEKEAMGRYLDGRAAAVIGTHTHVQTADNRILPGGTAYLSDAGMCGPTGGVIGVETERVVGRFLNALPFRAEPAKGPAAVCGCVVEIDDRSGRALAIELIHLGGEIG